MNTPEADKEEAIRMIHIAVKAVEVGMYDVAYDIIREVKEMLDKAMATERGGHILKRKI